MASCGIIITMLSLLFPYIFMYISVNIFVYMYIFIYVCSSIFFFLASLQITVPFLSPYPTAYNRPSLAEILRVQIYFCLQKNTILPLNKESWKISFWYRNNSYLLPLLQIVLQILPPIVVFQSTHSSVCSQQPSYLRPETILLYHCLAH